MTRRNWIERLVALIAVAFGVKPKPKAGWRLDVVIPGEEEDGNG